MCPNKKIKRKEKKYRNFYKNKNKTINKKDKNNQKVSTAEMIA